MTSSAASAVAPDAQSGEGIVVDTDAAIGSHSSPSADERAPVSDGAEVAARDTTGIVGLSGERETFIPLTRVAIFNKLTDDDRWGPGQAGEVRRFFRFLAAWRHQDYMERLMRLKDAYLPFSPDRDTVRAQTISPDLRAELQKRTIGEVCSLLERANYRQVSDRQINQIFAEDSAYGLELNVDLDEFEELLIYVRGATTRTFKNRTWRKLWLGHETREVPIYQRLFLLLKLKDEDLRVPEIMQSEGMTEAKARKTLQRRRRMLPDGVSSDFIYLKLFKQIPRSDLQMMFPNTRVQFKLLDKIKLGLTAGGGTLMSIVTTVTKVVAAINPVSAALALIGLIGVIFRQVMKFFNQRNQYMMVLAQNLYFHTLADNRGVLTLLADRAEEEDIKEEMLLYALIVREPLLEDELEDARAAIEAFLEQEFGVRVRYDLHDALERLIRDKVVYRDESGALAALSAHDGAEHIDALWDNYLNTASFFEDSTQETPQAAAAA